MIIYNMYIYILSHDIALFLNNKHHYKINRTDDHNLLLSYLNTLLPTKFSFVKVYKVDTDIYVNLLSYLAHAVNMVKDFFSKDQLDKVVDSVESYMNKQNIKYQIVTDTTEVIVDSNRETSLINEQVHNNYGVVMFFDKISEDYAKICKEHRITKQNLEHANYFNKYMMLNNYRHSIIVSNDNGYVAYLKTTNPYIDVYTTENFNLEKYNKNYKSILCCDKSTLINGISGIIVDTVVLFCDIDKEIVDAVGKFSIKDLCVVTGYNLVANYFDKSRIRAQTDTLSEESCIEYFNKYSCRTLIDVKELLVGKKYRKDKLIEKIVAKYSVSEEEADRCVETLVSEGVIKNKDEYYRL